MAQEGNKAKKKATKKATKRTRKPAPKKAEAKSYQDGSIWTPISGYTFGGPDQAERHLPSPIDLAAAYEDIVFACVYV